VGARAAFVSLCIGMASVAAVAFGLPKVTFLWHNVVGVTAVVVSGYALSAVWPAAPRRSPN
jgi:hypothetical protein